MIFITVKEAMNGGQTMDHALCLQIWSLTRWELSLWRCKDSPAGIALRLSKVFLAGWALLLSLKAQLAVGRTGSSYQVTSGGFCG